MIDSQSVKTTEAGGPRGYDAGKCIKGRKRHFLTDTNGLLVAAIVHAAAGYAGPKRETALARIGTWSLQIIKRSDTAKGFEATIESAVARIFVASIKLLSRRAARA